MMSRLGMRGETKFRLSRREALLGGASLIALAGCDRAPDVIGVDNPEIPVEKINAGREHRVFMGSTRAASEVIGAFYGAARAPDLSLASVDVHVPPNHVKGVLEMPKQLPPDPLTEFAIVQPALYANDQAFIAAINRELAKRPPSKRDILVFVHGYNTTASEGLLRLGQFIEDTNYEGVPVLFTWASAGQAAKYVYDINSALVARPLFGKMAAILSLTNANGFDIFAHSMGSLVTMEGILELELLGKFNTRGRLKTIVLASPDIDIDLFESQLKLMKTDRSKIYVLLSEDDSALWVSRIVAGGVDRLGNASADRVAALGVNVVDLSKIEDAASGSHEKFASSPEVVQLIGLRLNASPAMLNGGPSLLGTFIGDLPIRVIRQ